MNALLHQVDGLLEKVQVSPGYGLLDGTSLIGRSEAAVWEELEALGETLGTLLPQDHQGGRRHIIRAGDDTMPSQTIFSTNTDEFEYHTDGSYLQGAQAVGFVTIFCRMPAASGGETQLVTAEDLSAWLGHHEPDALRRLLHPMRFLVDQALAGAPTSPVIEEPAVWYERDTPRLRIHRWRMSNAGELDVDAKSALHALGRAFQRLSPSSSMLLKAGDVLVLNNTKVAHARSAFVERDGQERRTLYRLWIGSRSTSARESHREAG